MGGGGDSTPQFPCLRNGMTIPPAGGVLPAPPPNPRPAPASPLPVLVISTTLRTHLLSLYHLGVWESFSRGTGRSTTERGRASGISGGLGPRRGDGGAPSLGTYTPPSLTFSLPGLGPPATPLSQVPTCPCAPHGICPVGGAISALCPAGAEAV